LDDKAFLKSILVFSLPLFMVQSLLVETLVLTPIFMVDFDFEMVRILSVGTLRCYHLFIIVQHFALEFSKAQI
jgi:hypothetical protein